MTRHLPTLLLILLCGCTVNKPVVSQGPPVPVASVQRKAMVSATMVSVSPSAPTLHITCTPAAMVQDSTDLLTWQNIGVISNLDVLATGICFYRAEAQPTFVLAWDASPGVTGYKIYWGAASHNYANSVEVGNVTTAPVIVTEPSLVVYFAATSVDASGIESDFSNEVAFTTPQPVLTITR